MTRNFAKLLYRDFERAREEYVDLVSEAEHLRAAAWIAKQCMKVIEKAIEGNTVANSLIGNPIQRGERENHA